MLLSFLLDWLDLAFLPAVAAGFELFGSFFFLEDVCTQTPYIESTHD